MAAGVNDVVPHVGDRHEEVGDLRAGRRLVATDDPCMWRVAGRAACGNQHVRLAVDEVGDGEGVPRAAASPEC